ncbi:MAG: SDR family oxidoreductase [Deltaproteobacteria bacterium]|nr:SDR family oxidoreductase [Deltaproteobacteria bacterium]
MARALVTGGAGFLGSHLVDALLARGDEVICLDNFFSGSRRNVTHHIRNPKFELLRHDITQPILLEVDQIFHLACPASPVYYQLNPVKTIKTNVMGTLNMLGLAKRVKARILLASTSEVYGNPDVHPQPETYWGRVNPIGPRSCYDEGKRVAETLLFDYRRQNNVDGRVVRIFNTYGPRMALNDGRVVSNFCASALLGEPVTIYGDGSQTRSFCFVSDLIRGMILVMDSEHEEAHGPINLGNPDERSVLELAEKVIELSGSKSSVEYRDLPKDDPVRRKPDIKKAEEILKWEPRVGLETGLLETLDYFKATLRAQGILK